MFAEDNISSSSSKEYLEKTNEILYNKKSPLSVVNRATTNNNSSLKWVYDAKIFSVEESNFFHGELSRIKQNEGVLDYTKNTAGEYMIPVGNKIVFTDGDYEYPYVREVIEVLTEYAIEFEDIKRCIFNVEKGKSEKQDEARIIEQMYGTGYIISYNSGYDGVYAWENGRRKGKTRKEVIRNYLNKQFGKGNGRESQTAQVNGIAPIKETSSEGDVFFDAQNNADFSLSATVSTEQRRRARDIYGDDVSLDTSENIAPIRENVKKADSAEPVKAAVTEQKKIAPVKEDLKASDKEKKFG